MISNRRVSPSLRCRGSRSRNICGISCLRAETLCCSCRPHTFCNPNWCCRRRTLSSCWVGQRSRFSAALGRLREERKAFSWRYAWEETRIFSVKPVSKSVTQSFAFGRKTEQYSDFALLQLALLHLWHLWRFDGKTSLLQLFASSQVLQFSASHVMPSVTQPLLVYQPG